MTNRAMQEKHSRYRRRAGALAQHVGIAVAIALAAPSAGAAGIDACAAETGATRNTLVELFTSEGCNSCPPADRWLSGLTARDDLVAVAFHVDYWDRLGWTDRFASPRYTKRQHERAAQGRSGYVYTPQVLVDGQDFRQWAAYPGGNGLGHPAISSVTLRLGMTIDRGGSRVQLDVEPTESWSEPGHSGSVAWIAVVEDGLSTEVAAGENAGKRLRHDRVVQEWFGPFPLDKAGRAAITQRIARSAEMARPLRIVGMVETADGRHLQAAQVTCGGSKSRGN